MNKFLRNGIITIFIIPSLLLIAIGIHDKSTEAMVEKLSAMKADYTEDKYTTDLNYQLCKLATDLDLFVYTMKLVDNYIFVEEDFKDFELYSDLVIYGDESYKKANDLEYKIETTSMMVGVINYHMDDIYTFIYSLGNNKSKYEFLWKNIYEDIEKVNKTISDYETYTGYELPNINTMKQITNDIIKDSKEKWDSIEGTVYPQGSLE